MESMRDIDRAMEREIAKGSCPLKFVGIEFGDSPIRRLRQKKSCWRYCPICCGQAIMGNLP